jgi:hypothetical protein
VNHLQAVYYRDPAGFEPVRDFVDALPEQIQAAVENQIARLNLLSDEVPHLPFPHSSQVEGELRELRCHYGAPLPNLLPTLGATGDPAPRLPQAFGEDPCG